MYFSTSTVYSTVDCRAPPCYMISVSWPTRVVLSEASSRAYYWGTVVSRSFCFEKKRTFIFKKAAPLGDTEKLRGKGDEWARRSASLLWSPGTDSQEHWPPGNRAGDLQLPSELNRKLFVYNSRHTCGRKRSTVLMITQGDRHKPILTLNREEFEGVMAAREEVEKEIVNFGKKL
ncbi:Kinesin member [Perkinsus olseni]|uniref:Kinesin member n=1 Tax=Perkinsus olseni TaxID=32597 RepID=A0A7J6LLR6_PEROL|nr:Kinesin member [Perkinsus olseni]